MDDEENNPTPQEPGVTQIPLIHDLVFDSTQPLKSPRKPASVSRKRSQYPPGYDPDTADLFEDILEDIERKPSEAEPLASRPEETGKKLTTELSEALSSILEDLKGDTTA